VIRELKEIQIEKMLEFACRKPANILVAPPLPRCIEMLKLPQRLQTDRRKVISLDISKINAAAFDVNNIDSIADNIVQVIFYRSITAAMHHQRALPPKQPGSVDQFRKF